MMKEGDKKEGDKKEGNKKEGNKPNQTGKFSQQMIVK
jgi:hypothetical protein